MLYFFNPILWITNSPVLDSRASRVSKATRGATVGEGKELKGSISTA